MGELEAVRFLCKIGYKIVERNFRLRNGELDIIAIDNSTTPNTLVFVEVKTRLADGYGDPLEAITFLKLKALIRTASYYHQTHHKLPGQLRVDAIAVSLNREGTIQDLRHVKNICE